MRSALAEDGEIDAASCSRWVHRSGWSQARGGAIRVIASPDSSIGSLVAVSLARSFGSNLDAVGLSVAVGRWAAAARRPGAGGARRGGPPGRARSGPADAEDQAASQSTFFAIGMAVFFLFFAVEFGVRGLLEEREDGTLSRLLVAPDRSVAR